eukprot:UN31119
MINYLNIIFSVLVWFMTCNLHGADLPGLPQAMIDLHNQIEFDISGEAAADGYRSLLAKLIRIGFHDCVGGCNGCVNMAEPDNGGLQVAIDYIENLYSTFGEGTELSKADIYAYASMVALNVGIGSNGGWNDTLDHFEIGRETCPDVNLEDHIFPDAHAEPFGFMTSEFNLTANDVVALMGVHGIGRTQIENSGFEGDWVSEPRELDNQFYDDLIGRPWRQIQIPESGKFQWVIPPTDINVMLNADVFIWKTLNIDSDGRETNADCRRNFKP